MIPRLRTAALAIACLGLATSVIADDDRERAAALAAQARHEAEGGDVAAAVRTMERAEAEAPGWPELKVNLAALRSRAGDYAGAARSARAALALDPSLDGARFNLGLAQFKSGDHRGAAETLERYRGSAAAPPAVHVALGLSDAALERAAEASAELGLAVAAGSRDPAVLYALARTRRANGDAAGASAAQEMLAAAAPGSAAWHMLHGDSLDQAKDWAGAEAAYRRALATDDRFPGSRYSLGLMLYKRRDYDAAARELDRELELRPDDIPALYYRAALELDRGQPAAGVSRLERLTAVAPGRLDAWRELGRAYLALDRSRPAVAALRRAVEIDAGDARAHFLLARALKRDGQPAAAQVALRRAAELNRRLREDLQEKVSP